MGEASERLLVARCPTEWRRRRGEGFCVDHVVKGEGMTNEATMSWTDERVEQLRQHWTEGKSASQIAALLGHGLTRNAIIGKVHRLGFAGRAKSPSSAPPRPRVSSPHLALTVPPRPARPRRSADRSRRDRAGARAADRSGGRTGRSRERRAADVAPGDHRRIEGGDVPLAARRPGQPGLPLLRLACRRRSVLRSSRPTGLSAGPGPPAGTGARPPAASRFALNKPGPLD